MFASNRLAKFGEGQRVDHILTPQRSLARKVNHDHDPPSGCD
jgi:hypothetical protein